MAETTKFQFEGFNEFDELVTTMIDDFGEKDAKQILANAVRQSMKPVLARAKILAPIDTGLLVSTLQVEARKPKAKDRNSKYVESTDGVIGLVTTKAFPKKLKEKFFKENMSLYNTDKKAFKREKRKFYEANGMFYDGRAIAVEFGTAKMAGKPFLRPAMEASTPQVLSELGGDVGQKLEQYKAKQAKRTNR